MKGEAQRGTLVKGAIVKAGTCGFPGGRKKVFSLLDAAEVQESFYNLLSEKQISNIVSQVPPGFSLTMKAWQVTTHPSSSPTWKRLKTKPKGNLEAYGWMRTTKENLKALEETMEQAKKLRAEVIVFQTPASMPLTDNQKRTVVEFLENAITCSEGQVRVAWEPRGNWVSEEELLRTLEDKGVVIVVDALKREYVRPCEGIVYTRLHGLGKGEVNYRYKYTRDDLLKLKDIIVKSIESEGVEKVYVMFNNVYMLEDALEFKKILEAETT